MTTAKVISNTIPSSLSKKLALSLPGSAKQLKFGKSNDPSLEATGEYVPPPKNLAETDIYEGFSHHKVTSLEIYNALPEYEKKKVFDHLNPDLKSEIISDAILRRAEEEEGSLFSPKRKARQKSPLPQMPVQAAPITTASQSMTKPQKLMLAVASPLVLAGTLVGGMLGFERLRPQDSQAMGSTTPHANTVSRHLEPRAESVPMIAQENPFPSKEMDDLFDELFVEETEFAEPGPEQVVEKPKTIPNEAWLDKRLAMPLETVTVRGDENVPLQYSTPLKDDFKNPVQLYITGTGKNNKVDLHDHGNGVNFFNVAAGDFEIEDHDGGNLIILSKEIDPESRVIVNAGTESVLGVNTPCPGTQIYFNGPAFFMCPLEAKVAQVEHLKDPVLVNGKSYTKKYMLEFLENPTYKTVVHTTEDVVFVDGNKAWTYPALAKFMRAMNDRYQQKVAKNP